ncbi:MAG: hypothetical protein LBI49_07955 [Nocardiopsaceae bacterium]|jgi:hypothetical protein|nr:hypothetical protein [Nocardiopsaceae bacterium]
MAKKPPSVVFTGPAAAPPTAAAAGRLNAAPTAGPAPPNAPARHYAGKGRATLADLNIGMTLTCPVATISGQAGSLLHPATISGGSLGIGSFPWLPPSLTVRGTVTAGQFIYDAPSASVIRGAITVVDIKVSVYSPGCLADRFTVSGLVSFSYTASRVLTVNPEGATGLQVNSAVGSGLIRAGDPAGWTGRYVITSAAAP